MVRSLYVHFPFCETKCHYCDFYSLGKERTREGDPLVFEQALNAEALLITKNWESSENQPPKLAQELDTVFFGGGTPSMTQYDSLARALEPIWKHTRLASGGEWTMEANPSSIELHSMRAYRKYGVNRISMGVQALQPELLKKLGRVHSREAALAALETVFEAGFTNVSVDLLCGVPGQTYKDLEESLALLTSFPIQHLSCYLLTLPRHHRLYSELPKEDTQLGHLEWVHNAMAAQGFEHYEISNYARPGRRAEHNLRYWKGFSYLGLGPSAHSYDSVAQKRWKNVSSLHKYASILIKDRCLPVDFSEVLNDDQIRLEKWMLALRLSDGFPLEWLTSPEQKSRAKHLENQGLLEPHPTQDARYRLSPRGYPLSDQIISVLAS